jgi:DNA-binding NtrC family response regulator
MAESIARKSFREDLYYRLSSFVMSMPSLRQRKEEIPMMLRHFMMQVAERYACPLLPISPRLVKACENYLWPGNIRELENFVKRYLVLGDEEGAIAELEQNTAPELAAPDSPRAEPLSPDLKQMVKNLKGGAEMEAIANALEESGWNRKRAAGVLNISYKALLYKIRQYDIHPRHSK